jgi:hypothetical protein
MTILGKIHYPPFEIRLWFLGGFLCSGTFRIVPLPGIVEG